MDKIVITEPGIYDMPEDVYHSDPCCEPSLSSSGAVQLIEDCPSVYWEERKNPPDATKALTSGKVIHDLVLMDADFFNDKYIVQPEDMTLSTKAGRAFKEKAVDMGLQICKWADFKSAEGMAAAIRKHPVAKSLLLHGTPEQSIFWRNEEFGIWCRLRMDFLPDTGPLYFDYKTTISAHPREISKHLANFIYFQKAAWYREGLRAAGVDPHPKFLLIFQEKRPPYEVVVTNITREAMTWGEIMNRKAMSVFAKCVKTGYWPGYTKKHEVITVDLPQWMHYRLEDQLSAGAFDISMEYHKPIEGKGK